MSRSLIQSTMLGSTILLLASGLVVAAIPNTLVPPKWSPVYTVKGVIHIPRSDVQEPFEAWFDSIQNQSRIDYYDGMLKTYQDPPAISGHNWTLINVHPMTTETELNVMTCRQYSSDDINIQPALPDLTDYKFVGEETLLGTPTAKWQLKVKTESNLKVEYTMWVTYELDKDRKIMTIPKKYEVTMRNPAKGTFIDHVFIEYSDYEVSGVLSSDVFNYFNNGLRLPCMFDDNTLNPIHGYIHSHSKRHEQAFAEFKTKHGKQYKSEDEHEERLLIFRDNLRFIESHNRAGLGYTLAVNHLADRTDEELKVLRGSVFDPDQTEEGQDFPYSEEEIEKLSASMPVEFDWRLRGAVTPVKNQMGCGSCWSFSVVGAMESAMFLKTGKLVRFSEQALVDCSWGAANHGCSGGDPRASFPWIKKHGLPTYEAYGGYLAMNGYCHMENVTHKTFIKGFRKVNDNENALKVAIFKHGPVSVCAHALKSLVFYSHGVYFEPQCDKTQINHAMLAVGFGTMNNQSYWLIKNSWGEDWGMNGYVLMSTTGDLCGVQTDANYVVV